MNFRKISMNLLDMKGRHAVITGGATGLGFAIAQRMLASGACVTIWDRDVAGMAKAAERLGVHCLYGQDVLALHSDGATAEVTVADGDGHVTHHFDGLIVCAGVESRTEPLRDCVVAVRPTAARVVIPRALLQRSGDVDARQQRRDGRDHMRGARREICADVCAHQRPIPLRPGARSVEPIRAAHARRSEAHDARTNRRRDERG